METLNFIVYTIFVLCMAYVFGRIACSIERYIDAAAMHKKAMAIREFSDAGASIEYKGKIVVSQEEGLT